MYFQEWVTIRQDGRCDFSSKTLEKNDKVFITEKGVEFKAKYESIVRFMGVPTYYVISDSQENAKKILYAWLIDYLGVIKDNINEEKNNLTTN